MLMQNFTNLLRIDAPSFSDLHHTFFVYPDGNAIIDSPGRIIAFEPFFFELAPNSFFSDLSS